jgi:hypothetical protein
MVKGSHASGASSLAKALDALAVAPGACGAARLAEDAPCSI